MLRSLAAMASGLALTFGGQAQAQALSEAETALLRDQIKELKARVEQLERRLAPHAAAPTPAQAAAAAPAPTAALAKPPLVVAWQGAPKLTEGDRAFKPKGRIQADASVVTPPRGLADRAFGFSSEFRRIRLGGEGKLGGGFGYKLELELSDNAVDLVDTFVTYERGPWLVTVGNHNQFQSLDELTGDTSGSLMERAAFTDAFNFERRLGLSAQYRRGALLAQLGVFADDASALANDSDGPAGGDENDSFSVDGRLVYAPKIGGTQLHFAASAHQRRLGRLAEDAVRYRQRPYAHSVNTRLIGTRALRVREERSQGLELAMTRGPVHFAAEGHRLHVLRVGAPDLSFHGGYAEVGYYLTRGDRRPYSDGIFGTATPRRSLADGGRGAIQVNVRYDYLDLNSRDIRGGTQSAYLVGVIWTPIRYLRLNLNYGLIRYTGATALPDGMTDYGVHVLGSRIELDF